MWVGGKEDVHTRRHIRIAVEEDAPLQPQQAPGVAGGPCPQRLTRLSAHVSTHQQESSSWPGVTGTSIRGSARLARGHRTRMSRLVGQERRHPTTSIARAIRSVGKHAEDVHGQGCSGHGVGGGADQQLDAIDGEHRPPGPISAGPKVGKFAGRRWRNRHNGTTGLAPAVTATLPHGAPAEIRIGDDEIRQTEQVDQTCIEWHPRGTDVKRDPHTCLDPGGCQSQDPSPLHTLPPDQQHDGPDGYGCIGEHAPRRRDQAKVGRIVARIRPAHLDLPREALEFGRVDARTRDRVCVGDEQETSRRRSLACLTQRLAVEEASSDRASGDAVQLSRRQGR